MANSRPGETFLITGGAGFIGSHLVDRLVAGGGKVVVYDNFDPYYDADLKRQNVEAALATGKASLIQADVRDGGAFRAALESTRPDTVVHLAARPGVRPSFAFPEVYLDINVGGTLNVLRACGEFGVQRLLFASSSSVYGSVDAPAGEMTTPCRPLSPYGASKVAGEALCSTFARDGMSIIALRFFTVYGPRQRPDMAIHRFSRAIFSGEPVPVFGDGSSQRDYTYVSDVVDGIVNAAARTPPGYNVFNLAAVSQWCCELCCG
jgi:UDP-glucuronate 4-epimerase